MVRIAIGILMGLMIFLFLVPQVGSQENEIIDWTASNGEEFEIIVPPDYETLREWYLIMTKTFQEESIDHGLTIEAFENYQTEVNEELIPAYEEKIDALEALLEIKNKPDKFRPYVGLSFGGADHGDKFDWSGSGSIGALFIDSILLEITAGYPGRVELGIGWMF